MLAMMELGVAVTAVPIFQMRQPKAPTPASNGQSAYSASPLLLRGPLNTFCKLLTCAALKHCAVFSPLQVSSLSLNAALQAGALFTIPSAKPSSASHFSSTLAATKPMSAGLKACEMMGLPSGVLGATAAKAWLSHAC